MASKKNFGPIANQFRPMWIDVVCSSYVNILVNLKKFEFKFMNLHCNLVIPSVEVSCVLIESFI